MRKVLEKFFFPTNYVQSLDGGLSLRIVVQLVRRLQRNLCKVLIMENILTDSELFLVPTWSKKITTNDLVVLNQNLFLYNMEFT